MANQEQASIEKQEVSFNDLMTQVSKLSDMELFILEHTVIVEQNNRIQAAQQSEVKTPKHRLAIDFSDIATSSIESLVGARKPNIENQFSLNN